MKTVIIYHKDGSSQIINMNGVGPLVNRSKQLTADQVVAQAAHDIAGPSYFTHQIVGKSKAEPMVITPQTAFFTKSLREKELLKKAQSAHKSGMRRYMAATTRSSPARASLSVL